MRGEWRRIEAERQVRPDHRVEVRVGGVWRLGGDLEWRRCHTLPLDRSAVGEWVREWPTGGEDDHAATV